MRARFFLAVVLLSLGSTASLRAYVTTATPLVSEQTAILDNSAESAYPAENPWLNPETRNGLLCAGDPVNWVDDGGLQRGSGGRGPTFNPFPGPGGMNQGSIRNRQQPTISPQANHELVRLILRSLGETLRIVRPPGDIFVPSRYKGDVVTGGPNINMSYLAIGGTAGGWIGPQYNMGAGMGGTYLAAHQSFLEGGHAPGAGRQPFQTAQSQANTYFASQAAPAWIPFACPDERYITVTDSTGDDITRYPQASPSPYQITQWNAMRNTPEQQARAQAEQARLRDPAFGASIRGVQWGG